MKRKFNKYVAFLIAMAMMVLCLGACNKAAEPTEPSSEVATTIETESTTEPSSEPVTDPTDATTEPETTNEPTYDPNWGWDDEDPTTEAPAVDDGVRYEDFDWSSIPDYEGLDVIIINDDEPMFASEEKVYNGTFITLLELDYLGRCQVAFGCVGQETEPSDGRENISDVHPSGWKQRKLPDGTYLYNRSHLLMFALTGLNADERNLITGTEYFNQRLMLAYESMVLWTVDNMNAHVLYRVTPVFEGENLVAKGVLMEAYCIEYPEDCTFCVFVYNIEPGVGIDYATGKSWDILE